MRPLIPLYLLLSVSLIGSSAGQVATQRPIQSSERLRQIALVQLPGQPGFDGVAMANGNIVISHPGAQSVDIFNPLKRRIVAHVQGISAARGIAVDDASKTVFIADSAKQQIAVVSSSDWSLKKTLHLDIAPQDLVFVPKQNALYVSAVISPSLLFVPLDGTAPTVIDVGGRVEGMAYDPQTSRIFAAVNNLDEIAVLEGSGAQTKIADHWKLNASQPTGLVFDSQVGRLFVAVRYAVLSLNANTGQEISRVPTSAGTDTLRFEPSDQVLYAGSTDGTVTTIAANKGTLLLQNELRTDVKGHCFAVDPQSHLLYLPGGREGKSKLVILKPFSMRPDDSSSDDDDAAKVAPKTQQKQ